MGLQARPRHARRPGEGAGLGRMAKPGSSSGPLTGRQAPRLPARQDPLVHPVAITEHCVIGDQIRVPAAWCDMAGCHSRFADPAALGETDNRARALAAGWGLDACRGLVCPACQQRHRRPVTRGMIAGAPETAGVRTPAAGPAGPPGRVRQSVRSLLIRSRRAVSRGRHWVTRGSQMLFALATGSNGWSAPQRVTAPDRRPIPRGPAGRARPSAAHHSRPRWRAEPGAPRPGRPAS